MSTSHEVEYTCPYCGKQFAINVYDAVEGQQDPDLRDRCVSGEIFMQTCPHCGKQFLVQNELTYVDTRHHFVIWVSQTGDNEELLKPYADKLKAQGYTLRRCKTVQEFTEKIQILEDEVSDVMVELAKYDSFIEFVDNGKGKAEDVTSVEYQRTENEVMHINVKAGDKGMAFLIPLSMLEEEMDQNKDRYKAEDVPFPVVNADWMVSLFTSPQGQA